MRKIILVLVFALILILLRLWNLAARPVAHDESLFGYFAYELAQGNGYLYDPMLHGPFLLEAQAAIFKIFGSGKFQLRLAPLLCGLLLFPALLILRPFAGRRALWCAALLLLVSPAILFYSRFLRNDLPLLLATLLTIGCCGRAFGRREPEFIVPGLLSAAWMCCIKENAVFVLFVMLVYGLLLLAVDALRGVRVEPRIDFYSSRWIDSPNPAVRRGVLTLYWCLGLWAALFCFDQALLSALLPDATFTAAQQSDYGTESPEAHVVSGRGRDASSTFGSAGASPSPVQIADHGSAGALLSQTPGVSSSQEPDEASGASIPSIPSTSSINWKLNAVLTGWTGAGTLLMLLLLSYLALNFLTGFFLDRRGAERRWARTSDFIKTNAWLLGSGALAAYLLLTLVFTVGLSKPASLLLLLRQTVAYWWAEHASQRLGGPYHYYPPLLLIYEAPALLIVLGGALNDIFRGRALRRAALPLWLLVCIGLLLLDGVNGRVASALNGPLHFLCLTTVEHALLAFSWLWWGGWLTLHWMPRPGGKFVAFCWLWCAGMLLCYAYAGEKAPWLVVHQALPLLILAGLQLGRLFDWLEAASSEKVGQASESSMSLHKSTDEGVCATQESNTDILVCEMSKGTDRNVSPFGDYTECATSGSRSAPDERVGAATAARGSDDLWIGGNGRTKVLLALCAAMICWQGFLCIRTCILRSGAPFEIIVHNHTRPELETLAQEIAALEAQVRREEQEAKEAAPGRLPLPDEAGRTAGALQATRYHTAVNGEAVWPLVWYLRELQGVSFSEAPPARGLRAMVRDPGAAFDGVTDSNDAAFTAENSASAIYPLREHWEFGYIEWPRPAAADNWPARARRFVRRLPVYLQYYFLRRLPPFSSGQTATQTARVEVEFVRRID